MATLVRLDLRPRHGARELHLDVFAIQISVREACLPRLGARDLFELERASAGEIDHRLVAGDAAPADRIEVEARTGRDRRDVVNDLEGRGLRRQQFVAGVLVLGAVLGHGDRWGKHQRRG